MVGFQHENSPAQLGFRQDRSHPFGPPDPAQRLFVAFLTQTTYMCFQRFAVTDPMTRFIRQIPEGDDRERLMCPDCGHVAYENPKVVVGSVIAEGDHILMCRRAIEPRSGFWTIPAGYMELGETAEEGAAREAWEEARVRITLEGVLAVYSIARIGQVQVLFRAHLATPGFAPGEESLEVRLFAWDEIPWDELAFPSVHWVLNAWREAGPGPLGAPRTNPAEDQRGIRPLAGV